MIEGILKIKNINFNFGQKNAIINFSYMKIV